MGSPGSQRPEPDDVGSPQAMSPQLPGSTPRLFRQLPRTPGARMAHAGQISPHQDPARLLTILPARQEHLHDARQLPERSSVFAVHASHNPVSKRVSRSACFGGAPALRAAQVHAPGFRFQWSHDVISRNWLRRHGSPSVMCATTTLHPRTDTIAPACPAEQGLGRLFAVSRRRQQKRPGDDARIADVAARGARSRRQLADPDRPSRDPGVDQQPALAHRWRSWVAVRDRRADGAPHSVVSPSVCPRSRATQRARASVVRENGLSPRIARAG